MPRVKVNDINMYYEVHGEGEPLALINGYTSDSTRWARILSFFSKEYKVIVFDNRGVGQSDKPDIPYTIKMMVADLAGLLDTLDLGAAHIFGVSMGGMIAQQFALDYPQKVVCLILGCTTPGGPNSVSFEGAANTISPEIMQSLSVEEAARLSFSQTLTKKFIDNNPEVIEELVAQRVQNPPDPVGQARQFEAVIAHDAYERLPDIKSPTLVITGDEDILIPPENSRILASRIPKSELVVGKELGHGFFIETPCDTSKIIIDFIKRNSQNV